MFEKKQRVLIIDRHPLFRKGLVQLLRSQIDLIVCGEADNAELAMTMAASLSPDLITTDLRLKQQSGLHLIDSIRSKFSSLPILVVSTFDESLYCEHALRAGARGFIMKDEPWDEMAAAIRLVLNGRIYLSSAMGTKLLSSVANGNVNVSDCPTDRLSDREREVFTLLGEACATREIAERLKVSIKTVETYREHLKIKLNLDNSIQLIRRAVEWVNSNRSRDQHHPVATKPGRLLNS